MVDTVLGGWFAVVVVVAVVRIVFVKGIAAVVVDTGDDAKVNETVDDEL